MGDIACCCAPADIGVRFEAAKWFHFGLFTFSSVATWILRDYADEALDWVPEMDSCKNDESGRNACFGKGAVLRLSFALFIFHFFHALFLIRCKHKDDPRTGIHTAFLSLKWIVWAALVVLAFFIPDDFYKSYGEVARVLSGLFLVFQALVIINVIYMLNESMVDREECLCPLVSGALSTFAVAFTFMVLGFVFYAPSGSCSLNIFWITWTLILAIIMTLVSISKWRVENAGLFTSGIVCMYCAFLLLSALNSKPHDECEDHGGVGTEWIQIVSFCLALGSVLISTMSMGTANIHEDGESEPVPYRPDYFHLIFALAALYIAMLFTNWDLKDVAGEFEFDEGMRSAWIKIGSQWFIFVVYGWTLLAPKILKNRDFA